MAHQGERSTALAPFFPSPGHLAWPPRLATLPSLSDPLQPVDQQGLTWTTPLAPLQRELTCRTSLAVQSMQRVSTLRSRPCDRRSLPASIFSTAQAALTPLQGSTPTRHLQPTGTPPAAAGLDAHRAAAPRTPVPSEAPFTPTALFRHPPCPCPYLTPPALSSAPW